MSSGADDDIRADFLIEAGELVQRLGEQLVELEGRPDDRALLNDIFRAFHTVKGGAGFLELTALVDLCHAAEDVFNVLRAGRRGVDAALMDAVLQAVDRVQTMMQAVGANQVPAPAPESLLQSLRALASEQSPATEDMKETVAERGPGGARAADAPETGRKKVRKAAAARSSESAVAPAAAPAPAAASPISEDEFEALLDQLHGKGKGPGQETATATADAARNRQPASAVASAETSVRVDTNRLDKMMNLVGELVLVRNRLKDLRARHATAEQITRAVGELDFITRGLQNAVMQIRMQPIRKVFSRFPKIARDVARGLGKQVEVELVGEGTDLDKNLVEALADPLVHMVRNSVDHGIEMPEERVRRGKSPVGHLTLSAHQEGDHILISVRDDGAGMDAERIRAKALEKGLLTGVDAAQLSAEECLQLVFLPGFSTKEQVSDLSGRGVGMDVVMSRIKSLGGAVHIDSHSGSGSTVRIRVPLTLAILSALMVQADGRQFAVPLAPVLDIFELDAARIQKLDRWDVVLTRRETLRLVYLDPWLAAPSTLCARHVVVAQVGEERYGFVVREVRGREEIVIKPLGVSLRGLVGVSGATVLPDGHIALILDFSGLVEAYRRTLTRPVAEPAHG